MNFILFSKKDIEEVLADWRLHNRSIINIEYFVKK